VEHWRAEASTRLWTLHHSTYTFCVADSSPGLQAWTYRRSSYGMREGVSTMLIEPGEVHVTTKVPLANFHVLLLDAAAIAREFTDEAERPGGHFATGQSDDPVIARAFLRVCHAVEDPDVGPFERRSLLRRFLFLAFARASERPPVVEQTSCERGVLRARDLLVERHVDPPGLDEIAAQAGVSKYHLERSFRARFGVPMHRYLMLVRLGHARRLLQRGLRLVDVAHEAGFSDAAHMGRIFRTDFGFTPGTYARANGR
jgi:AraC-like DNA-binding protein